MTLFVRFVSRNDAVVVGGSRWRPYKISALTIEVQYSAASVARMAARVLEDESETTLKCLPWTRLKSLACAGRSNVDFTKYKLWTSDTTVDLAPAQLERDGRCYGKLQLVFPITTHLCLQFHITLLFQGNTRNPTTGNCS